MMVVTATQREIQRNASICHSSKFRHCCRCLQRGLYWNPFQGKPSWPQREPVRAAMEPPFLTQPSVQLCRMNPGAKCAPADTKPQESDSNGRRTGVETRKHDADLVRGEAG